MAGPPPLRRYTDDHETPTELTLRTIGVVRSPHLEGHGTPRQAHVPATARGDERARIELWPHAQPEKTLRDLAGFGRLWIISFLHLNRGWRPEVVVPRGPRVPRSLFATRAPHRPNPIGLSVAEIVRVEARAVVVRRTDLLDGTPVLDLKPYVPEFDAFVGAEVGWLAELDGDVDRLQDPARQPPTRGQP